MLNSSCENGQSCLVPDFRGNAFNFSPLRIMFAVGLSFSSVQSLSRVQLFVTPWSQHARPPIYLHFPSGEDNGTPLQCSCLENPTDRGAWKATVHGVTKSRTRLSDFTFTFHLHVLEKEMATHSIVLTWRVPGTGEPVGLQSMGSHRVGHNRSNLAAAVAAETAGQTHSKHYPQWWKIESISPKVRNKTRVSTFTTTIQH